MEYVGQHQCHRPHSRRNVGLDRLHLQCGEASDYDDDLPPDLSSCKSLQPSDHQRHRLSRTQHIRHHGHFVSLQLYRSSRE